jgi:hypothetical protein
MQIGMLAVPLHHEASLESFQGQGIEALPWASTVTANFS